jgi:hypothetical protein
MRNSTSSELIEGTLRSSVFISKKEPLKEDISISDEGIVLMVFDIEQFGKLPSSLFKNTDQLILCATCSYLQQVIQVFVHFLVVVRDPKMLKTLRLEFLEDDHYESSIHSEGLNSRDLFLLGIVLDCFFMGWVS